MPFSPIEDGLPAHLAGVYLGGGYPERHCHQLSANKSLRASLLAFARAGGVIYGECGGLLYLTQSLQPLSDLPSAMGECMPLLYEEKGTIIAQGASLQGLMLSNTLTDGGLADYQWICYPVNAMPPAAIMRPTKCFAIE